MDRFRRIPPWLGSLLLAAGASVAVGGCISGRILEGYPGYPFLAFDVPADTDTVFFGAQRALQADGFELDYSDRSTGLIATRPDERGGGELFLNVVVDSATGGGSRVWVAAYRPSRGGARRINPLAEEEWATLREITHRLSERLGGTTPVEPAPPDGASEPVRRGETPDSID